MRKGSIPIAAVSRAGDGQPSGIQITADDGCARRLDASGRTHDVSRRQRLLLADCLSPDAPRHNRVHRSGRHARVGRRGGRVHHSFTGEYGGYWRRNNRAPQALAGVGFISQGSTIRRTARAPMPRTIRALRSSSMACRRILGDFGILQGGAAGLEIDCVDPMLGTPPHAGLWWRNRKTIPTRMAGERGGACRARTDRRRDQPANPCRHGVLRDPVRWCGIFHRIDRLCRFVGASRLRQSDRPVDLERAAAVRRSDAVQRARSSGNPPREIPQHLAGHASPSPPPPAATPPA